MFAVELVSLIGFLGILGVFLYWERRHPPTATIATRSSHPHIQERLAIDFTARDDQALYVAKGLSYQVLWSPTLASDRTAQNCFQESTSR